MPNENSTYRYFEKCAYKNCMNGKTNGKRLYKFPLQTDKRHYLWIRNGKCFI